MTNLKRSFFWAAFYLAVIFILGEFDYSDRPIINFASYFYLVVMVAVPVTLFFPALSRISVYVPMLTWAGVYILLLQMLDRALSTESIEFPVIVLEFVLLEVGVWLAYQLALQIGHAESVMDALALSAFPNRAHDIDSESQRIKIELTRSRRYRRPLSLVIIEAESGRQENPAEMLKGIQHDLLRRFTAARIGQIIDDSVRQTDLVARDHRGRFVVLCPETDLLSAGFLGQRISRVVKERTNLNILTGVAAFPEEALTFDDLLQKARERLNHPVAVSEEQIPLASSH